MASPGSHIVVLAFVLLISSKLAECHNIVRFLPGFQGPLPFLLETGYVEVGETEAEEHAELFYYFIESENDPKGNPLLLWLTGGPGCSAFSGLVFEIGPLTFKNEEYNGSLPNLTLKPQSWTKVSSIIFVDLPAGTGFSYPKTERAVQQSSSKLVRHAHQFIRKWLIDHPEFLSNEVYIAGDSYCGIPVPVIVQEISNGNEGGMQPWIYIQSLQKNCRGEYRNIDPRNALCLRDMQSYEESHAYVLCSYWANDDNVRKALHVRKGSIGKWTRCNDDLKSKFNADIPSSFQYHVNLSRKGYRSLIYSGDHDMVVPFLATQAWIRSLNYSIVSDWRQWYYDGQVAGYTRTYSNRMTFATVKGGGHTAPEYKPEECLAMFSRWISNMPL
ncbi:serine carboxypeptidase-like 7 isoform X5 [Glycine soja]|uniref:Serine carboxypeptidase-like 19 n=2 Tax=Glycine max TaxID=3847 RepID=A0A0R0JC57_SOYBN|nr:serine carboxypeptidase-like 7 isoform X5 [Glycine soja]